MSIHIGNSTVQNPLPSHDGRHYIEQRAAAAYERGRAFVDHILSSDFFQNPIIPAGHTDLPIKTTPKRAAIYAFTIGAVFLYLNSLDPDATNRKIGKIASTPFFLLGTTFLASTTTIPRELVGRCMSLQTRLRLTVRNWFN